MSLCPPPRQSNFQNSLNKALFFLNPVFITILWGYFGVMFKLQGNVFASQRKKNYKQFYSCPRQHCFENLSPSDAFSPNMSKNGFSAEIKLC